LYGKPNYLGLLWLGTRQDVASVRYAGFQTQGLEHLVHGANSSGQNGLADLVLGALNGGQGRHLYASGQNDSVHAVVVQALDVLQQVSGFNRPTSRLSDTSRLMES